MSRYGLFLDIQATQSLAHSRRGIARFVAEQAIALVKHQADIRCLGLNPTLPFPSYLEPELLCAPQLSWSTADALRSAGRDGPLAYYIMSPFELTAGPEWVMPPVAAQQGLPVVVTLYDLIPLTRASYYLKNSYLAQTYNSRAELVRQADLVLTISKRTREDAINLLGIDGARVTNIGAGVSPFFRPRRPGENLRPLLSRRIANLNRPFILTVGGAEDRKNTERLIEAFALLPAGMRASLQLVITCSLTPEYRRRWLEHAAGLGLSAENVILTNYVDDTVLRALYQSAELFVFPSLYEGFGLPAAEAAACGCPTITSNTSALPEILDSPPATFDPLSSPDMAKVIQRGISDPKFKEQLQKGALSASRTHTWDSVARKTIRALDLLPQPRRTRFSARRVERSRIALVGPFEPTRSGIADYNTRLTRELERLCELDAFVTRSPEDVGPTRVSAMRTFPIDALGTTVNPSSYDAIIYSFGNSTHHHRTYEIALNYPGIVWLHDVRLGGFYISYGGTGKVPLSAERFMAEKLGHIYGQRVPPEFRPNPPLSAQDYVDFGLGMTKELVRASRAVVVNSRLAERLLKLDQGPMSPAPTIGVIPLAAPRPLPHSARKESSPALIASFGIVAPVKAPDILLDALAIVRKKIDVKLALVGPVEDALAAEIASAAEEAGVRPFLELTGSVDEAAYWQWLGRAACAVQIRKSTNGESSAAINDCLAAGVPVLTNIPASAELPQGTVDLMDPAVSAEILADRIVRQLENPPQRLKQAEAGRRYCELRSFATVATEIVELVKSLEQSPASQAELWDGPGARSRSLT